jgi:hypothetical protein
MRSPLHTPQTHSWQRGRSAYRSGRWCAVRAFATGKVRERGTIPQLRAQAASVVLNLALSIAAIAALPLFALCCLAYMQGISPFLAIP